MREMCYTESVRDQARGVKRRRWRIRWWAARADRRADGRRGHWRIVPVANGCEPGPVPVVVATRTARDNTRAVLTPPGRFGGRARPSGNPGLLQREAAPSNGGGFAFVGLLTPRKLNQRDPQRGVAGRAPPNTSGRVIPGRPRNSIPGRAVRPLDRIGTPSIASP